MNTDKIYAESIAKEYAPKNDSKIVALRKLDAKAKMPATVFTYTFGIISSLIAGLGICLSMQVIGGTARLTVLGIIIGIIGFIGMGVNYPIYKRKLEKGNPIGQILMVLFSLLYGIISYSFNYYGEMVTYPGMTMPMSVFALISWLKNPYKDNKSEVKVNNVRKKELVFLCFITAIITVLFYFILKHFNTANLIPSTISVTTSFVAVYLTARRSPYFALAYASNDIVLIILWIMASTQDIRYLSVVVCFAAFFINDIYGYISWQRMKIRQKENE